MKVINKEVRNETMGVDKKVKREEESRKTLGRLDFSVMEGTVSSENEQLKNQEEFRRVQGIGKNQRRRDPHITWPKQMREVLSREVSLIVEAEARFPRLRE